MKSSSLLLACSVIINVVLLGFVVRGHSLASQPTATSALDSRKTNATPAKTAAEADAWKALNAGDGPADLQQRLRAAGFPDRIIHAIIAAQIHERYAARRAALQADDAQYWSRSWNSWGGSDAKTRAAFKDLNREERQEIKKTLGDAYADNPEYQRMIQRQFGNIPKDKVPALQTIAEDYGDLTSEIYQTANGFMLPEDREKLAFLEKEKRADLAAVLTPQELQDYELRSSQTAGNLRWQLSAFSPSEQEFRSVFALQREFELQFPDRRSSNDEAANQQRADAQTALQNQIKATLGETRYAEYQRSQDGNYQQLASLAQRLELPKENATAVYDLSKEVEKRAQQIRSDPKLKTDERNQALTTLQAEATAKVTASLGDRGLQAYKENGGGWWLRNIAPRPAAKPAAK